MGHGVEDLCVKFTRRLTFRGSSADEETSLFTAQQEDSLQKVLAARKKGARKAALEIFAEVLGPGGCRD